MCLKRPDTLRHALKAFSATPKVQLRSLTELWGEV